MQFIKRFYIHRETTALLLTSAVSLLLFFNNQSPQVNAVRADVADFVSTFAQPKKWYMEILSVKAENQMLRESLVQLQLLNARLIRYRNEINELREMLGFAEESPLSLRPCSVVDVDLSASVRTITLDVGRDMGVEVNLPVMDMNGLIGKTVAVGDNATLVQLITDKNFKVSIRVGDKRSLGIFSPTHGNFGQLEGIQKSLKINPGDRVFTSGISDIYPADIPVGQVVSAKANTERGFQDVIVKLNADIYNLNYVFIIQ